jgi:hypothetical protein
MPMPAQICQIWLRTGMISNWSASAQIGPFWRCCPASGFRKLSAASE